MDFNEYQAEAKKFAIYPKFIISKANYIDLESGDISIIYPTLGLIGEIGELDDKLNKQVNDDYNGVMSEMSDVLWYISEICSCLDSKLSSIAGCSSFIDYEHSIRLATT